MSNAIEIDGKILHPVKEATNFVSYSRDYITRLAREEKIVASTIAGQWFVDIDSLKLYESLSALEQDVRKSQLSEERKRERQIRDAVEKQNSLHDKKEASLHQRALVTAALVLGFGLTGGYAIHQVTSLTNPQQAQLANTFNSAEIVNPNSEIKVAEPQTIQIESEEAGLATQEVKSLGDVNNGILLLPSGTTLDTEEIFSDMVIVKKMSDGSERVVRVDGEGNLVGQEIPFVRVPVPKQNI